MESAKCDGLCNKKTNKCNCTVEIRDVGTKAVQERDKKNSVMQVEECDIPNTADSESYLLET
jgi:hypothetical protein